MRTGFRGLSIFLFMVLGVVNGVNATTYYSAGNNAPNTLANWWTNTNGTGTHPANFTTAGDIFTIQSGHTMTTTGSWSVTGTILINLGGTLTTTSFYTVSGGTITVNGTYNHGSSGTITGPITVNVNGVFNNNSTSSFTIASAMAVNGTFNNAGTRSITFSGTLTVNGTFNNGSTGTITGTGAKIFNNGSLYKHTANGGSIPTATWNTGSTCEVSGITSARSLAGLNQSFYHFKWSSANTRSITFSPVAINGNLDITNGTSGAQLSLGTTSLTVGGNLSISNANAKLVVASNTARTVIVNGNISITAGTLNLSGGSATGTLNVLGNFTHSGGTITETSSGKGSVVFKKSGVQSYTSGGTLSNAINFTVNSGATLQMGTGASPAVISSGSSGTFTLASGATLGVTSPAGITTSGATGNIQVTGARTYAAGASYIYNGNANQAAGTGLTQNKPSNMEINNPGNTVSLGAATTMVGSLKMTAGTLELNGYSINVGDITGSGNIKNSATGPVTITNGSDNTSTTFTGTITNTSGKNISLVNNSTGVLTLGGANTYTGTTTIHDGTLRLGATNAFSASSDITLDNATLSTGATSGYTTSAGKLNLTQNSTLALGTGVHAISFANSSGVSWPSFVTLTITGWKGGFNGTSGTEGKIFVGAGGLTSQQLSQIQFQNGSDYYPAKLLASGELVATGPKFVLFNLSYPNPNYFLVSQPITPLVPNVSGTPTNYTVSPGLPTGLTINASTGVISGTPTATTPTATYQVTATDGTNTTKFGIEITVHLPGTYYARTSGNWDTPATWSLVSGNGPAATTVPMVGDIVYIGDGAATADRTVTIPIGYSAACATLNLGTATNGSNNTLTMFDATTSLDISGNVTIIRANSNNKTTSLNVNDGTVNVGGNVTMSGTDGTNRITLIVITTGELSISGALVLPTSSATASNNVINMSGGAGTLDLAGVFSSSSIGTLTAGTTSTFNFNGTAAQTIPIGRSNIVYNNITLNNSNASGATIGAAITTSNVTGNLSIQSGVFNNGGYAINLNGTDFSVSDGATFNFTGTSGMVTGAATKTFEPASTTNYSGTNQTVSNEIYGNLILSGSGTKSISSGATMMGDFTTSGSVAATAGGVLDIAGDMTLGNGTTLDAGSFAHNVGGNWVNNGTFTPGTSTVNFNGTNQSLSGTSSTTFNNIAISDGSVLNAGSYNFTVNGNWADDGDFVPGTGTVTFATTTTHTISGNTSAHVFNNLSIGSGSTLDAGSNDITLTGNWASNGTFVPGTGTMFFSGSGTQTISGTSVHTFNNLDIAEGSTVSAGSSGISLTGDWNNDGTFTPGTSTVTFKGTGQSIMGAPIQTFYNLTISPAGGGIVTIPSTGRVTVTGALTNTTGSGTSLTIESDATNSGSLIVTGTSSGNITYKRYMTGNLWHVVAAPVSGQSLNSLATGGSNAIAANSTKYAIGILNESTDAWANYTIAEMPAAGNLIPGKGYEVKRTADGTVSFTGAINGDVTGIPITYAKNGWNAVGNPYTSAINLTASAHASNNFLTANSSSFEPSYAALYVWDPATSTYKTINNAGTGSLGEVYIQAGQGFIVRAKKGGGTMSFTRSMQTHQGGIAFKAAPMPWPTVKLIAESGNNQSNTQVCFNAKMTNGLDVTYDAGMFKSNPNFALYSRLVEDNGVDFAIQCLPEKYDSLVIPIGMDAPIGTTITFHAEIADLPAGSQLYLEDRVEEKLIPLDPAGSSYTVTITSKNKGVGAFFLRTAAPVRNTNNASTGGNTDNTTTSGSAGNVTSVETTQTNESFKVIANPKDGFILIISSDDLPTQVKVYDISGKLITMQTFSGGNDNYVYMQGHPGIYVVQIINEKHAMSQKVFWY